MRQQLQRHAWMAVATLATLAAVAACSDPEAKMRKQIAGAYALEMDGGPKGMWSARQVITLREDGNWTKTAHIKTGKREEDLPADSGTYRITGVTVNLRSLVTGGAPVRYTVSNDTLYGANAAQVHAVTGYDIGEEIFVRGK